MENVVIWEDGLDCNINGKEFKAIKTWWEDNDFHLMNEKAEQYCLKNAYPTSLEFPGLDYSSSDIVEIEMTQRYNK